MSNAHKIEALMMQVLRETTKGKINWELETPPESLTRGTEDYIPVYVHAKYKNTDLAIYEVRSKYWRDEDEYIWTSDLKFAVLVNDTPMAESKNYSPALSQLFDEAKGKAADIDGLLDDLMK